MAPDLSTSLPPPSPRVSKAMKVPAASGQPSSASLLSAPAAVQQSDAVKKKPRQLLHLSPIGGGGGEAKRRNNNGSTAATVWTGAEPPAERAARAQMWQALAKRVAWRMLKRRASSSSPASAQADEGSLNVLACCCPRVPPGLRCALHQAGAPGWSWMRAQRGGGSGGGAGEAVAPPRASGRGGGWAFCEYARWRGHVWMPSRFYLERVEEHWSNGIVPMKCA